MRKKLLLAWVILNLISVQAQTPRTAIDSLEKKLTYCKDDTSKIRILEALSVAFSKVDPDRGLKYALTLKAIAGANDNKSVLAAAYSSLGLNYAAKCDYRKAAFNNLNAIKIYRNLKDKRGEGAVLANMSHIFLKTKRLF